MTIRSEDGPGEINEDTVKELLPRIDSLGRPFGSVFNLHREYSRCRGFVSFPALTSEKKSF